MIKFHTIFVLALTPTFLLICSLIVWKLRSEVNDLSRIMLSLLCSIFTIFSAIFLFRIISNTNPIEGLYLVPEDLFGSILLQLSFCLYPFVIYHPKSNRAKIYSALFVLPLGIVSIGVFSGINYTELISYSFIWDNINKPDVLFRLLSLFLTVFYGFTLYILPFDKSKRNSDKRFINFYSLGMLSTAVFLTFGQLTHNYVLILLHYIIVLLFFSAIVWYELRIRHKTDNIQENEDDQLWNSIMTILEENEGWRDNEMSLTFLTTKVLSNRTYIEKAFNRNCGMSFYKYISKRRIDYITETLKKILKLMFRIYSITWASVPTLQPQKTSNALLV